MADRLIPRLELPQTQLAPKDVRREYSNGKVFIKVAPPREMLKHLAIAGCPLFTTHVLSLTRLRLRISYL